MSKLFLLTHPARRFDEDFTYLSLEAQTCQECGDRVDRLAPPLRYEWDKEFQSDQALKMEDRQIYIGGFLLMVPAEIREKLKMISAFNFFDTSPVQTELVGQELVVKRLPQPDEPLYWAMPKESVRVGVSGTPNEECPACGYFTGPRQLTRLQVRESEIPKSGVFSVAQNRSPQIFVTEDAKAILDSLRIEAGYYSAGRTVST